MDFAELCSMAAESGKSVPFYGVDNLRFKLGTDVFEAVEDESDGYRSYLQSINVVPAPDDIFHRRPLAKVWIKPVADGCFDGWDLLDVTDGHRWLRVGTDNTDDYYPSFRFEYQPKAGVSDRT